MPLWKRFFVYLLPSLVTMGLGIVLIPVTTAKLDPEDFGLFALYSIFGALLTSLSSLGSAFFWATFFPKLSPENRPAFVSSLLWTIVGTHIVWAVSFFLMFARIDALLKLPTTANIPASLLLFNLALLSALAQAIWIAGQDYLVLEGKAGAFAVINITASLSSFLATLLGLYVWNGGVQVLFYSAIVNALILSIGVAWALRSYLATPPTWAWVSRILREGLLMMPGNAIEALAALMERTLLHRLFSLDTLGVNAHSQRYRAMAGTAIKALTRAAWPVSLAEAREKSITFSRTMECWSPVYFMLGTLSIASAAVGHEVIGFITHGKFTVAAPYVTAGLLIIGLQNSGKEATAVLYTHGKGFFMSVVQGGSQILLLFLNVLLIPRFSIWGAIGAICIQTFLMRTCWQFQAQGLQTTPWNETPLVLCSTVIIAVTAIQTVFHAHFWMRTGGCSLILALYLVMHRRLFHQIADRLRHTDLSGKDLRTV